MITQLQDKIKGWLEAYGGEAFLVALVLLVSFLGFGLWRLHKIASLRQPIRMLGTDPLSESSTMALSGGTVKQNGNTSAVIKGQVVASKNGTRYHLPTCPGARTIKEVNRITFASEAAAKAAGYTRAANCK